MKPKHSLSYVSVAYFYSVMVRTTCRTTMPTGTKCSIITQCHPTPAHRLRLNWPLHHHQLSTRHLATGAGSRLRPKWCRYRAVIRRSAGVSKHRHGPHVLYVCQPVNDAASLATPTHHAVTFHIIDSRAVTARSIVSKTSQYPRVVINDRLLTASAGPATASGKEAEERQLWA